VPSTGPVIWAPNHVSYLDPNSGRRFDPPPRSLYGKQELFKNLVAAWTLRSVPAFRSRGDAWVPLGAELASHGRVIGSDVCRCESVLVPGSDSRGTGNPGVKRRRFSVGRSWKESRHSARGAAVDAEFS
jgi:hypothetical protein